MIEALGILAVAVAFAAGFVAASSTDPVVGLACCLATLGVVGLIVYGGSRV